MVIAVMSVTLVIAQGISSYFPISKTEAFQPVINKEAKIITIQDSSEDKKDSEDTQSTGNLPGISSSEEVGSQISNTTGGGLSDELTGGGSPLGEGNQTQVGTSDEQSTENNNQTLQSENQVNQDVNQTQSTNQNVNVNQTNNQNVNVVNKQKLELSISEEENQPPISVEEQTRIESQDKVFVTQHKGITAPECRSGNVLAGASNAKDLRVLADCQDATGTVMHTKKMDDGDYKFFLKVDDKYAFLVNDKNDEKTDGFLVVEVVPKDQDISSVDLPSEGDKVHIWEAWVTDEPKGWHEIHPTWVVTKE